MKPEIKNELLVKTCPNAQALSISIATQRALNWIATEGKKYTENGSYFAESLLKRELPANTVLLVSECFGTLEVKRYLENPNYEEINSIKVLGKKS